MNPFRAAVEARDMDAVPALLAPDVTFRSPVVFAPYQGREIVSAILRGAERVFEDFAYESEMVSADGCEVALVFRARIGDRAIHGCDFLHLDGEGLIDELCVMVRPFSAAQALKAAMAMQFEMIAREAR